MQPKTEKLYTVRGIKKKKKEKTDQELTVAPIVKFRLKLKKVGKTTRPFRYDLNQIPYNSTVKMTHRLKGLDLIDRVPEELCTEVHDTVQEAGIKTIPKKKQRRKAKWLAEEALEIAVKRREVKGKGEKMYPFDCRVPKNSKER